MVSCECQNVHTYGKQIKGRTEVNDKTRKEKNNKNERGKIQAKLQREEGNWSSHAGKSFFCLSPHTYKILPQ